MARQRQWIHNKSIKSWLEKNAIELYSADNEGKSVIAERFIIILKNKISKYMTYQRMCILVN